jgi:resuscitation-promoting factor RpfB
MYPVVAAFTLANLLVFGPPPLTPNQEQLVIAEVTAPLSGASVTPEVTKAETKPTPTPVPTTPQEEEQASPAEATEPITGRNKWDQLADCESGNWIDGGASFEVGSARWYWAKPGTEVPPWGTTIHHGGLQFHPGTWASFKLEGYPEYAYDATREQQIAVAERVLAAQGWGAWPTCASKLGWR